MTENILRISVSLESLEEAILSLGITEKRKLLALLEAELFSAEEDSSEDIAEIQAARADYVAGNYMTFDQYQAQRANYSA
ncbi:MAG: hypothetical protein F6K14_32400 [Symploca sp. SIO2C1]|nr:hypothetical protein [Symploca sp. SIO2C1]